MVHCHEGGARSGVFLAVDQLLSTALETSEVDVFGTVRRLLNQRRCLVPSPENLR